MCIDGGLECVIEVCTLKEMLGIVDLAGVRTSGKTKLLISKTQTEEWS